MRPIEFIAPDGKTVIGMDADMAKAHRPDDGPEGERPEHPFDSIIPGLAAGKYDLGMSSFTDTKEREKTVDFVTYLQAGTSFYVKADGGPNVDVARRPLRSQGRGREGHDPGRRTPTARTRSAQRRASRRHVRSSRTRTEPTWRSRAGGPTSAWPTRPSPRTSSSSRTASSRSRASAYGVAPYGIAIAEGQRPAQPVLDAVKALMADGTYRRSWTTGACRDAAISNPQINGATS